MTETSKIITIRAKTKVVEPQLYTMIFHIGDKYYNFQIMEYSLEKAVDRCTLSNAYNFRTPKIAELWWHFEMTITEIKHQLKRL